MNGLLVRVGADQTQEGGHWHGLVDSTTWKFAYVPIPEKRAIRKGLEKPYQLTAQALERFRVGLPPHLDGRPMHLDPDFYHLTYGDSSQRAEQIKSKVRPGDLLVFYAGFRNIADLRNITAKKELVYAIIGLYVVESIVPACEVPAADWDINAHTRRLLPKGATDIVVRGQPGVSGRLEQCLPVGKYRDRAYRVRREILKEWGGLSVKNGYLQRSARLPVFCDATRFYDWFKSKGGALVAWNN